MSNNILIEIYIFFCNLLAKIEIIYNLYLKHNVDIVKNCFSSSNLNINSKYLLVQDQGLKISKIDSIKELNNIVAEEEFDFIIKKIINVDSDKETIYGLISEQVQDLDVDIEIIEPKFMTIELKDLETEEVYDIDLSNPINFYLENNIVLDLAFVRWYMKEIYNIIINKYEIKLIDNNVKMHDLTDISYIELKRSKYCLANVEEQE